MKYDMLSLETVRRIWDKFQEHHGYINEKYNKFKGNDTCWSSDRERFVGRLFKKYELRYIAFIDKIVVGYIVNNLSCVCDPKSVYSNKYYKYWSVQGDPIFNVQKLYLKVLGFEAVNEMYGCGFIEMACEDFMGNVINIRVDYNNMLRFQFKEISKLDFDSVARLFDDDRTEIPFKVTRAFMYEEVKERKVKGKTVKKVKEFIKKEDVTVMAKDIEEARNILPDTISVERIYV